MPAHKRYGAKPNSPASSLSERCRSTHPVVGCSAVGSAAWQNPVAVELCDDAGTQWSGSKPSGWYFIMSLRLGLATHWRAPGFAGGMQPGGLRWTLGNVQSWCFKATLAL